jgi:hypothetical protein
MRRAMPASERDVKIAYNEPRPPSTRWRLMATLPELTDASTPRSSQPGARAVDLLIAASALAANLPLYPRNVDDFRGIEPLLTIIGV